MEHDGTVLCQCWPRRERSKRLLLLLWLPFNTFWNDRDTEFISYFCSQEAITLECSVKAPWLPVGWGMLRVAPDNTWYYTACGVSICVRNLDFARWKIGPSGHNGRPSLYLVLLLIELIRYPAAISCCYFCFHNIIKLKQSLGVGCFVFWEQGFYKHVMSVEVCARIPFSWLLFYLVTLLIKYWEDYIVFHRQM